MNLPNKITIARIILIPLFLVALLGGLFSPAVSRWAALWLFVAASLSDWLDGFLARKLKQVTNFGKLADPIADKLLVCSALIALVQLESIAAWMVIVIISREFIVSGVRLVAAEQGIVIAASNWAKLKTAMQMFLIIALILAHESIVGMDRDFTALLTAIDLLKWLTVGLTVISAAEYIYKNIEVFKTPKSKG